MKFSINIPAFNSQKYIRDCLESLRAQTYRDFEAIIIDDGSIDDTKLIAQQYADNDERFKVVSQRNSGQLMSRMRALTLDKGDYAIFLDSDDMLMPNALMTLSKKIEESGFPDMVFYKFFVLQKQYLYRPEIPSVCRRVFTGDYVKKLVIEACVSDRFNAVWCAALKTPVKPLDKDVVDLCKTMRIGEDSIQVLCFLDNAKSVSLIDEEIYLYRINQESVTHAFSPNKLNSAIDSIAKMLEFKRQRLATNGDFARFEKYKIENYEKLSLMVYRVYPRNKKERIEQYRKILDSLAVDDEFSAYRYLIANDKKMRKKYIQEGVRSCLMFLKPLKSIAVVNEYPRTIPSSI